MKTKGLLLLYVSIFALPACSFSAQLTNESFDAGANGWVGSVDPLINSGVWDFSGGEARVTFFNTGIPIFDFGMLSNSSTASSGAFTGNYDTAGINVIGFTFQAPTLLPGGGSNVVLRWGGSTSVFQRAFTVSQTGVWYNFSASLADAAKFEWDPFIGSHEDFSAARKSVSFVTIRFFRSAIAQHDFVVGSIYLGNQPEVGSFITVSQTDSQLLGKALLVGKTYEVESAQAVTGTWSFAQSFVATNAMQWVSVTNNSGTTLFWRMKRP